VAARSDPEYWRGRAEEARTLAEEMNSAETRRMMLEIADNYEKIAAIAEKTRKAAERS
jgi:hypothetical protein